MRSARSECLSLVTALALPVAVFLSFPYSAFLWPVPVPFPAERPPFAALVILTPEQEARAMQRAKTSGRHETANAAIRPSDLILRELPDDAPMPVVRISSRLRPPAAVRIAWRPPPYLPTQAAPPPAVIAPEKDTAGTTPAAFPKESLLRTDGLDVTTADKRQTTTTRKENRP